MKLLCLSLFTLAALSPPAIAAIVKPSSSAVHWIVFLLVEAALLLGSLTTGFYSIHLLGKGQPWGLWVFVTHVLIALALVVLQFAPYRL